jgi:hypothetical protein
VDTAEQAVEVTNRIQYGLTSSILADDTYKAFELAPKILHGIVNVNSSTVTDEIHAPMGGVRSSGWRRTGPECLADFSDIIWINTTSAERQFPVRALDIQAAQCRRASCGWVNGVLPRAGSITWLNNVGRERR